MAVPTLEHFTCQTLINCLIGEDSPSIRVEFQYFSLIQLLDHGSWGEESLTVLERLVKYYKSKVTPKIVDALLPRNSKKVSFKSCYQITENCLNQVMERCFNLACLDISDLCHLNFNEIKLFSIECGRKYISLTAVDLEECTQITDIDAQNLLRNAPSLQSLNISHSGISDQVFLMNQVKQLAREASIKIPGITDIYDISLQHVDISGCKNLTSTCIRHLCTLCGPSLRSVNMSWTKVDCTAFLYLSGLSLPSALQYLATFQQPEEINFIAHTVKDFEDLSKKVRQLFKWEQEKVPDSNTGANKELQLIDWPVNIIQELDSYGPCREEQYSKLLLMQGPEQKTDHSLQDSGQFPQSSGQIPQSSGQFPTLITNSNLPFDQSDNNSGQLLSDTMPYSLGDQSYCTNKKVKNDSDHISNKLNSLSTLHNDIHILDDAETMQNTLPLDPTTSNPDLNLLPDKLESINFCQDQFKIVGDYSENKMNLCTRQNTCTLQSDHPVCDNSSQFICDQDKISLFTANGSRSQGTAPLYSPGITGLCISGSVFDEKKGLPCFEKFLSANSSLTNLKLFGGKASVLVTDKLLEVVSAHSCNLTSISLEGCDRLSNSGVIKLVQCTKLTHIDLTGVCFINDLSIQLLVNNLQLSHLQLAETMINNKGLLKLASEETALRLTDLDLSWCEDIESDEGLNKIVCQCKNLQRLTLRECCMTSLTLKLLAQNCHAITELNISSNMNAVDDSALIILSENLPRLEKIFLDWNSYLTDTSISALLVNCPHLVFANLEGLKQITSEPFLNIISVPVELKIFLQIFGEKQMKKHPGMLSTLAYPKLVDLPCLPHRSMTYCTELQYLNLTYCDFIEDGNLENIAAVVQGSIKIIEYYGEEIPESPVVLEKYVNNLYLETMEALTLLQDSQL